MRSELYLNGFRVELKEEVNAALTLQISDIREPKTRNGSYSKTVKLPGSKTLNKLLGGIFDIGKDIQTSGVVNFIPDFNPNLKCTAKLYADGLLQFSGHMRLNSIERNKHDHSQQDYNVTLFGEVATIYTDIGDKKVSELSFSEYNHTYDKATQKATWTNTNYGTGYVYPMINYGGVSAGTWAVEDFKPGIYLKTYIDKIFSEAGYTYTSPFFNSAYFKRWFIPFAGDKLTITSTQATDRLFNAYTSIATSGVSGAVDPVIFNAETNDPLNQYNTGTGLFTVANSGYYQFYSSGVVTYDAISSVTGSGLSTSNYFIVVTNGSGTNNYLIQQTPFTTLSSYTSGQTIFTFTFSGISQQFLLSAGDTVNVRIAPSLTGLTGTVGQTISANSVFLNVVNNATILDGGALDMQSALPIDIKQADLLSSVFRTWNLYLEPDKNTPNNLIIDTYDDFYGSGTVRVWTLKVDASKPVIEQPMGLLDFRRYKLKYSDDTDYWNKFYHDKWQESYGEKNVDVVNDFLKNTNTNEVIFAPTPSIGSASHDRIIPEIFQLGNSGAQTATRSKLRLLYWGGAKATVNSWNYTSTVAGTTSESTYPYSGHVDDPISPTLDASFGVPREIYYTNPYGITEYTNNNIYNAYHSKFLTEITDKNSKLVTLYVRLRPLDIAQLSFRDKIFIDGHYYRLQKVVDYNPIAETVTKVELLKIKEGTPFTAQRRALTFTRGEMFDDRSNAPMAGDNVGQGDLLSNSQNLSTGSGNFISQTSRGVLVTGSSNRVGNNCENVSVLNSSGVVILDNLTNVSVVNTNNITVTESNVSYAGGVRLIGQNSEHIISTTQTISGPGTYYCNANLTLTLSTPVLRAGDTVTVKYIAGAGVTVSGGGININGSATYNLITLYDSVTIKYNGVQYYTI